MLIGATVYAFEIPNYFNWIETKNNAKTGRKKAILKTLLALLFFNSIWIFRHLLFLKIFSFEYGFSFKNILIISF